MRRSRSLVAALLLAAVPACEGDDPVATGPTLDAGDGGGTACEADRDVVPVEETGCTPVATDYRPRDPGSASDTWPACISDDDTYHVVEPSIGALGRVAAFEELAERLGFGGTKVPAPQDFLDARVIYTQPEGIESRVVRREDEHFPAAPKACRDMTATEQAGYPDRCVGPVKILPILNAAFQAGIDGADPVGNASKIEGALLWFFYVSVFKEATTAASAAKDCDSMWAKYTGGTQRDETPAGLGRYVLARSRTAHDRVIDGLLAVRCWRDLDNPSGAASNLALRDQARLQLDTALLRGLALIVRQRVQTLPCDGAWESAKILAGVLDREAASRDPASAGALREEFARAPDAVDAARVVAALDALFPCS